LLQLIFPQIPLSRTFGDHISRILRVRSDLNPSSTSNMFHSKTVYWRRVIIPDFLFLGIETYPLSNYRWFRTGGAPYWKGHFESNREDALGYFVRSSSQGMFSMQFVTRDKSLLVRRDISAHVEALH